MSSHHHPHHHHPHHGETFGSFSPYPSFGQADATSGDDAGGYFTGAGGAPQSESSNDEDYGYGKTKK